MAVQRLLQQEHWSKYRAVAFLCEGEPTLRRRPIYIRSLCSLKRLMSQTVEEESRLTFEYAASFLRPFTRPYIEFFEGAGSICYCSRDVAAASDSSWAALTFSSFPPTSPSFAGLEISGGDITGVLIKPGCHTLKGHQHRLNGATLPSQENTEELQSALQRNERANTALKVLSLVNCSKRAPQLITQMPQ